MKKLILILLVVCIILWLCIYILQFKKYFDTPNIVSCSSAHPTNTPNIDNSTSIHNNVTDFDTKLTSNDNIDPVYYDANKTNEIRNIIPDIDNESKFPSECKFKSVYDNTTTRYDTGLSYNDNVDMGKDHINCCLVEKKFIKIPKNNKPLLPSDNMISEKEFDTIKNNEDYINRGAFEYTYTMLKDEQCNSNLYQLDSNKQLMINGENGWNNNMCKIKNKTTNFSKEKLGSCRYANKECFDYVTPEFCDKFKIYGMEWSEKTCNMPLDFKFKDNIKFHVPMLSDEGSSVILFPQPDAIRDNSEKNAILFPPSNPNTVVNKSNNKPANKSYFSFYHPT